MAFDPKRKMGPNVKKLVIRKASKDAIPSGGGLADGIAFIKNPIPGLRKSAEWVLDAIDAVRQAPGGDKLGDDEAIAGEILRQIEAKNRGR